MCVCVCMFMHVCMYVFIFLSVIFGVSVYCASTFMFENMVAFIIGEEK